MRRTVKTEKFNGRQETTIIEEFHSFRELIDTNERRTYNFDSGQLDVLSRGWNGVDTYEEARDLLVYGWEDKEKINLVKRKVQQLQKLQETKRLSFKNDIVGFAPVVPNAIIGIPESMINCVMVPKKAKVINIMADVTYSCGTDSDEVLEWGAELVSEIMNLEKQGYRVRLELVHTYSENNSSKNHVMKVLMKSENQPFDMKRMMFPLAHVAMLRVHGFEWYRKVPEGQYFSGYGSSLIHHSEDHAEFVKKQSSNLDNAYYIICKEDIKSKLKDIRAGEKRTA